MMDNSPGGITLLGIDNMKASELRGALAELGWSQAEFAERIGLHQNTVTRWATGATAVPKLAAEYLRVVRLVNDFAARVKG